MKNQLGQIWREISRGKNIDLYFTVTLAFVIIWLSLFNVASSNVLSATILATLMLLAVASLHSRHASEKLDVTLSRLLIDGGKSFRQWKDVEFSTLLSKSRRVSMLAVANNRFLSENEIQFTDLIRKGGSIRSILVNPKGVALNMAVDRSIGASAQSGYVKTAIEMSKARLKEFADVAKPGQVKLKYIDHLPAMIITWLEFEHDPGMMLLTLTSFKQPTASRPIFTLSEEKDSKWYGYYHEYYENMWKWNGATDVRLD